jgi:hypothetical protein
MNKETKEAIGHWRGLLEETLKVKALKEDIALIREALSQLDLVEAAVNSGSADEIFWATWDFVDALRDTLFLKSIKTAEALRKERPRHWPEEVESIRNEAIALKKKNPNMSKRSLAFQLKRSGFGEGVLRKKWLKKWEEEGDI